MGVAIVIGLVGNAMTSAGALEQLAASSSISQDLGNDFLKRNFSGKRGMVVAGP